MKITYGSLIAALAVAHSAAFAPGTSRVAFTSRSNVVLNSGNAPFFASGGDKKAEEKSLEEEVEEMVQEEMKKTKKFSNLRNADGVDYAPWMNISAEDEENIRQIMKEKAEARRRRQEQERQVSGALLRDSQAQELSGTGLGFKILDENTVELEWATSSEANTRGFIIKRRPAKTDDFQVLASYEDWGPLASQGPEGGQYRYLDETVSPGGWVYRVTECEKNGVESDICQTLVEVQTADEQRGAVLAAVAFGVFAAGAVAAGVLLDPLGGY